MNQRIIARYSWGAGYVTVFLDGEAVCSCRPFLDKRQVSIGYECEHIKYVNANAASFFASRTANGQTGAYPILSTARNVAADLQAMREGQQLPPAPKEHGVIPILRPKRKIRKE